MREQIPSENIRASDIIKRFRSYLEKEAKHELDSIAPDIALSQAWAR
jgi:hypothetical protein